MVKHEGVKAGEGGGEQGDRDLCLLVVEGEGEAGGGLVADQGSSSRKKGCYLHIGRWQFHWFAGTKALRSKAHYQHGRAYCN